MMGPGLLQGRVWHRRHGAVPHDFHYPLRMVWVELADLDGFLAQSPLWGRRLRPATLREQDFLDGQGAGLEARVRERASALGMAWNDGRVFLLGQPRMLGLQFNPLALYWHFAPDSEMPDGAIAEVRNTPWGERHWYALPWRADGARRLVCRHPKAFHVSPFLDMAMDYHWEVEFGARMLRLEIRNRRGNGMPVFEAGLRLEHFAASSRAMRQFVLEGALQGLLVRWRIYRQAWRLWRNGARFHAHPDRTGTGRNSS